MTGTGAKRAGWGDSLVQLQARSRRQTAVSSPFVFLQEVDEMTSNQSVKATAVGDQDARQVADMDLTELQRRAGGLARELG